MTTPAAAAPQPVTVPLNAPANVVLNGSGNGTAKIGPISLREVWTVAVASIMTVEDEVTNESTCNIYAGPDTSAPNFVDTSFTGSSGDSTSNFGQPITAGMYVWAVWTGGDPGVTAQLIVTGTKDIY